MGEQGCAGRQPEQQLGGSLCARPRARRIRMVPLSRQPPASSTTAKPGKTATHPAETALSSPLD